MIDGEWGSGKTYFLKHSLLKIMESADYGKDKRRKYAYVSLTNIKTKKIQSSFRVFSFKEMF